MLTRRDDPREPADDPPVFRPLRPQPAAAPMAPAVVAAASSTGESAASIGGRSPMISAYSSSCTPRAAATACRYEPTSEAPLQADSERPGATGDRPCMARVSTALS